MVEKKKFKPEVCNVYNAVAPIKHKVASASLAALWVVSAIYRKGKIRGARRIQGAADWTTEK